MKTGTNSSRKSIWMPDTLTKKLRSVGYNFESRFSGSFQQTPDSDERIHTGVLSTIDEELKSKKDDIQRILVESFNRSIQMSIEYIDLSAKRREGKTGADSGIYLYINIPEIINSSKFFTMQVKTLSQSAKSISFSARELEQMANLIKYSTSAYYLIMGYFDDISLLLVNARIIEERLRSYGVDIFKRNGRGHSLEIAFIETAGVRFTNFLVDEFLETQQGDRRYRTPHRAIRFLSDGFKVTKELLVLNIS